MGAFRPRRRGVRHATVRRLDAQLIELAIDPGTIAAHELIAYITTRFEVEDVHVEPPPIEEVIARFYALHALEG